MTTQCKFHTKRGENIRLLQDGTIAERMKYYKADGAVVFTASPVPPGQVFQVVVVERATVDGTPGIGVTTLDPSSASAVIPQSLSYCMKKQFWVVRQMESYHGQEIKESRYFSKDLKDINTIGVVVTEKGDLHLLINSNDVGVIWKDLPTDQPLWGIVDVYGQLKKVRAEFLDLETSLNSQEKQSTQEQLKDLLFPTEKSLELARSIELSKSMDLTKSMELNKSMDASTDVTQSLFVPNLNGSLTEGKRAHSAMNLTTQKKSKTLFGRRSQDKALPQIQEEAASDTSQRLNKLEYGGSRWELGELESSGLYPPNTHSPVVQRARGGSLLHKQIQSQHQPTFQGNPIRPAYSLLDIGSRKGRGRSKTLGGLLGRKGNKDDGHSDTGSGGSSPKPTKSKKKQKSLELSDTHETERENSQSIDRLEQTVDTGSSLTNSVGLFSLRKASSTADVGIRSRTRSILDLFKRNPSPAKVETKKDKKQSKSSRVTVQSWKKDAVASSSPPKEQHQSFDEELKHSEDVHEPMETETRGKENEEEEREDGSQVAAPVNQLPHITVDEVEEKDSEEDEFTLRKAQSSFELGSQSQKPILPWYRPQTKAVKEEEEQKEEEPKKEQKEEEPKREPETNEQMHNHTDKHESDKPETAVTKKTVKQGFQIEIEVQQLQTKKRDMKEKEEEDENDSDKKGEAKSTKKKGKKGKKGKKHKKHEHVKWKDSMLEEESKEEEVEVNENRRKRKEEEKEIQEKKMTENEMKVDKEKKKEDEEEKKEKETEEKKEEEKEEEKTKKEETADSRDMSATDLTAIKEEKEKEAEHREYSAGGGSWHPLMQQYQYKPSPPLKRGRRHSKDNSVSKDNTETPVATTETTCTTPTSTVAAVELGESTSTVVAVELGESASVHRVSSPVNIVNREKRSKSFMSSLFQPKKSSGRRRSLEDQPTARSPDTAAILEAGYQAREEELQQEIKELQRENNRLREEGAKLQERTGEFQQRLGQVKQEREEMEEKWRELQAKVSEEVADINFWVARCTEVEVLTMDVLGSGACGMVYAGWFRGKKVAVKQIHPKKVAPLDPILVQRELSLMSKIHHPNLICLIAAVLDHPSGSPLLVTELMDTSVRLAYEQKRLAGTKPKLSVMRDVAAGLNYLHLQQTPIIHRDITSNNVLLTALSEGRWIAKLSDFGSAKLVRLASASDPYTAPETADDGSHEISPSPKLDVFSYGVLLCEVISEQYPEPKRFPSMLDSVRESWPTMHELIKHCTHTDPANRISMSDVMTRLPIP